MKLCHVDMHNACFQYGNKNSTIELIKLSKGEIYQFLPEANLFVFIHSGSLAVFCNKISDKKVNFGESLLIPMQSPCVFQCNNNASILMMKSTINTISFCEDFLFNPLLTKNGKIKTEKTDIGFLKSNQKMVDYSNSVINYINDELICPYFFDLKIQEFLYLIKMYYDKHTLFNFFKPIYNHDFIFSSNVYRNLDKVKTVKEMANTLKYSMSGFEKKFKTIFKMSPHLWMQKQKAKKIYYEINCTKKTFSEIAFDFGFSSPAHFNDFCKVHFNNVPGKVRKENEKQVVVLFR